MPDPGGLDRHAAGRIQVEGRIVDPHARRRRHDAIRIRGVPPRARPSRSSLERGVETEHGEASGCQRWLVDPAPIVNQTCKACQWRQWRRSPQEHGSVHEPSSLGRLNPDAPYDDFVSRLMAVATWYCGCRDDRPTEPAVESTAFSASMLAAAMVATLAYAPAMARAARKTRAPRTRVVPPTTPAPVRQSTATATAPAWSCSTGLIGLSRRLLPLPLVFHGSVARLCRVDEGGRGHVSGSEPCPRRCQGSRVLLTPITGDSSSGIAIVATHGATPRP